MQKLRDPPSPLSVRLNRIAPSLSSNDSLSLSLYKSSLQYSPTYIVSTSSFYFCCPKFKNQNVLQPPVWRSGDLRNDHERSSFYNKGDLFSLMCLSSNLILLHRYLSPSYNILFARKKEDIEDNKD